MFNLGCPILVAAVVAASLYGCDQNQQVQRNGEFIARCKRDDPCWPTIAELDALQASLSPENKRDLHWLGGTHPLPLPAPHGSEQPLFGLNQNLKPLYIQNAIEADFEKCIPGADASDFCKQSTRVTPRLWSPAFIAWPLTTEHVQILVKFAKKHRLCVSVAGTGHDFLNRHSCEQGLLIRTSLMKDTTWDLNRDNKWGHVDGSVRLGAGLTFTEVEKSGAELQSKRFVASGWCPTVGVIGWSLGGGHGPYAKSKGLAVDNMLEVELVLEDGTNITANKEENSDLFWALRGGGGSVWGVVTAITVRAHAVPQEGIFMFDLYLPGEWGEPGVEQANQFVEAYMSWADSLDDSLWSGVVGLGDREGKRLIHVRYASLGSEADFHASVGRLEKSLPGPIVAKHNYTDAWEFAQDGINLPPYLAFPLTTTQHPLWKAFPSVLIDGDTMKETLPALMKVSLTKKENQGTAMFNDLPGISTDSEQFSPSDTSISPNFRKAAMHIMSNDQTLLGLSTSSYFSESEYDMPGSSWKERYWGAVNYEKLLAIKRKYDPSMSLRCHQCVGFDE